MPFTDNNGVRLHWDERGSGTPVLLVMGAAYSSKMWYPVLDALAARHRVIFFDNRGTGDSATTRTATMFDFAADARAVLDAAGEESAHVYGVSLGGVIVQQFALESPERVRSLVLGCTGILSADKPRAPKIADLFIRLPRRLLLRMGRGGYGPACPPDALARDQAMILADKRDRAGLVAQQDALRAYSVAPERIATLAMRALVLHGTADRLVPIAWGEELARTLPNARFIAYDGAGHNYLVAAGTKPSDDVLGFLAEIDADLPTR
jgi:pimeloyl-ACP methyl ester carboxylesterase